MNSVALPVSASAPTLSTEGVLIRQAARGEAEAVAELFRRHGQVAWRLAQAVAVDRQAAIAAVGNGFARSLRGAGRRRAGAEGDLRPLILAAVYRGAMENARAQASQATPSMAAPAGSGAGRAARSRAKGTDAVLVEAAFRSLPERWRAALWLTEVETMTSDLAAPILGVSTAVAAQLTTRGARGFGSRFAQARRPVPEHLGPALRQIGLAMPANLEDAVAVRLKSTSSDPVQRFAPVSAWLGERATRPLQVAVGGLLGMGLIAIGLVGQGSSVPAGPVALSASPSGANPQVSQSFFPGSSGAGAQAGGAGFSSAFTNAASGAFGASGSAGASSAGAGGSSSSSGSGGAGSGGSLTALPGGSTSLSTPGGTGTGTPSPGASQPNTIVSLAPVATVTQSGKSATANVLPSGSGAAGSVTVGCSTGVGITVGTTKIGCTAPTTTAPTTTTTTTPTTLPILGPAVTDLGL